MNGCSRQREQQAHSSKVRKSVECLRGGGKEDAGVRVEVARCEVGDLVGPCRIWLGFCFLILEQC